MPERQSDFSVSVKIVMAEEMFNMNEKGDNKK